MELSRTVVSLFAGAGGLDVGLEQAGFTTCLAIDTDPDAIATLQATQAARVPVGDGRHYLAEAKIVHADLRKLTKAQLVELWGREGRPAVLAGGPPCQSFSSSGKMRGLNDDRGRLFRDFVRTARALRPHFIIFENVQGLVTARDRDGRIGGVLSLVQQEFESAGYACSWALVNAADYGAAQRRVRLVMIGTSRHELPTMPPAALFTRDGGDATLAQSWKTIREALKDIPEPPEAEIVRPRPGLAAQLALLRPGSGIRVGGVVENNRPGGHWGYRQDGFVADWDQPSRTIRAASTPDWLRLPDDSHRRLTWRECARLQDFPDGWKFCGSATSRFRQIGNAVPASLGRVLGEAVSTAMSAGLMKRGRKPRSAPWPASFGKRIRYTTSEDRVNGSTRRRGNDGAVRSQDSMMQLAVGEEVAA
jgi:DNA (cytosine-5)-methyltransferase 1